MLANAAEALTGFTAAIVRSSSTRVSGFVLATLNKEIGESYSLPAFGFG